MLHEARRAAISTPVDWPTVADARGAGRDGAVIPLAVVDVGYERLHPESLARGWARIRDGELQLEPQAIQSAHAFAAAALREHTYHGAAVPLRLDRRWWSTNGPWPVTVRADFDDGRGWRRLQFDRTTLVHYAQLGRHTLRLAARYADGAERFARFELDVRALVAPAPDDTLQVTASVPYLGEPGTGEAYVYLADGHAEVTQPVVVIEGFDIDDSLNWDELYALLNQESLLEDLRADGYDAVVLNFDVATTYLQRNGYLVATLLQQVRSTIDPATDIVLVGASMGGLLSRYALTYLESQAVDVGVSTFLSFDAPQNGANIPLGIQYWLDFFQDQSDDAQYLLSRLDSPGARQMLLVHHTSPPSSVGEADPLRTAFVSELAALGDWPSLPRKVAVANGSGTMLGQGFEPADQIIEWEYEVPLLVTIVGNCWAVADQMQDVVFDGRLYILFGSNESSTVSVGGVSPWDNAPGGSRASMAEMDSVEAPQGDIVALYASHAFIPTISALALDVTDPFFDVAGAGDLLALTPFDAVYYPVENQQHVAITPENKVWLLDEVEGVGTAAPPLAGTTLRLLPSVPNPFNPATNLRFELAAPARVTLEVFDLRGRLVRRLLDNQTLGDGPQSVVWRPKDLASGVYAFRVQAGDEERRGRVTLLK
jgi:hypothetical protein